MQPTIHTFARITLGLVVGLLANLVSSASAQVNTALFTGVNVDFDVASGTGSGQPSIIFGGAIGQGGYWNPVRATAGSGATFNLRNPANNADVLQMQLIKPASTLSLGFPGPASGDEGLLINDFLDLGKPATGSTIVLLGALPPAIYDLAVYAVDPSSSQQSTVVSVRSPIAVYGSATILGPVPANGQLVDQVTHRRLRFAHLRDETLTIEMSGGVRDGVPRDGTLNGLQIKKLTPSRLYVKPFSTGEGTGLDWPNALGNLRAALEIARVTSSVTEIWIAGGTYEANSFLINSTDRNEAFVIRGGLSIYGGFAGTEASTNQRTGAVETILTGVDRQYHTVVIDGQSNVILDGLTISDGFNDLPYQTLGVFSGGAGLFIQNNATNIIARRCIFRANRAPNGVSGAIGVTANSSLLLEDCQFHGNTATFAAAVEASFASSLTMRRCSMTNNISGGGSGGVIGSFVGRDVILENCLIANNRVELNLIDTGTATGSIVLRHCTIAHNLNPTNNLVGIAPGDNATVVNCLITGNAGPSGATGPSAPTMNDIYLSNDSGQIFDNSFQAYDGRFGVEAVTGNNDAEARFANPLLAGAPGGTVPVNPARYELASRSPARDSGFNFHATSISTDLKGAPRLVDDPYAINRGFSGSWVDRGCFEAQAPSEICPGDVGGQGAAEIADGARDNNDFIVFIAWFFAGDARADVGSEGAGLGPDGSFDNNDFVVFIQLFFEPCP